MIWVRPAKSFLAALPRAMTGALLWVLAIPALAVEPVSDLDALVSLALERDPEAVALDRDIEQTRWLASAARRPMDPELMVGVDALGAMEDAEDPTMFMFGVSQMLSPFGEYRARGGRAEVEAVRAEVDRNRLEADVRLRLWTLAARIDAFQDEQALLDQRIATAEQLLKLGLARYGSGVGAEATLGSSAPTEGDALMGGQPPVVSRGASRPSSGMAGMESMGEAPAGSAPASPSMEGMGEAPMTGMDGSGMGSSGMGGSPGLASLLRLDAEVASLRSSRTVLDVRLEAEITRVGLYVGTDVAAAVASDPERFLGSVRPKGPPPELRLAEVEVQAATADLALARAERRPDLMLSTGVRWMPSGMFAGVDVAVGITVPTWTGRRRIRAASAGVAAAESRQDRVQRDLEVARVVAYAEFQAAETRADTLEREVLPRTDRALEVTVALFGSGRATAEEAVLAWTASLDVAREGVSARRDARLRAADLDRLEGP